MIIIDGKKIAEKINDQTTKDVFSLGGARPNLAIILVGENPDSQLYVTKKIETGKKVGIDAHLYKCASNLGQVKLLEMVDFLNKDKEIDAIMVQLPLPKDMGYETDAVIAAIQPEKDLDRFHPENVKAMLENWHDDFIPPPVYGVIFAMLEHIKCDLTGKKAAVLSKSEIFGGNLAKVLEHKGARAYTVHPDDPQAGIKLKEADLMIPVIGRPKYVKKEMVKNGAVIIDVGITRELGSIYGDVDFEDVKDLDGYISPVPGGVGPVTVAITLRNALELYKQNKNNIIV
jgi:methylenetetrahydrofolate dehydrogenase (NADP+) / methenyltetrahydrofolate cyclohydrolase